MAKRKSSGRSAKGLKAAPILARTTRICSPGKVFRDPVHRLIRVAPEDEFILDIIDSPELQRLRRIRQLGVSWITYHGAEHSRFTHSLGVFNFAQRIIESLQNRYGSTHPVYKALTKHSRSIKAAALVHDIGHAPFSHMLERAFGKSHHEERTIDLIMGKGLRLNDVLKKHGIPAEDVASIIRKDFPDKLAVDIVSSQLDADRMDYLLRDSYCTGVGYGEYDSDWLLHSMCVGRVNNGPPKLCLDRRRGLYGAERFIIARLHMYQQVYMHRVTRGFEVLALNLFKAAAHRAKNGGLPATTPSLVGKYFENDGKLDLEQFLQFDESQIIAAFHCWTDATDKANSTIRRLSKAFLNRERLYASANIDSSPTTNLKLGSELPTLPKETDGATPIYGVDTVEDTSYKGILYSSQHHDDEAAANMSILLADPNDMNSAVEVESQSKMLKNLDAETFMINRLYYDRSRIDDLKPLAAKLNIDLTNR
jgi:HD superfamily phosphohydrolase